jgi:3-hydroxyacyl-[acyl-carrier-protein] dehydratase
MKLLGEFFTIRSASKTADTLVYEIELNRSHVIFDGHFPGYPVTPGVIQLQILNELSEYSNGLKLRLHQLDDAKYLKVLNPDLGNLLLVNIRLKSTETPDIIDFRATIHVQGEEVMKARGKWKKVQN